jgi:histidinol-phosphate phosphatase family protein
MSIAVFLDRDGVLCENRSSYVKAWQEFQWIPGARQALSIFERLNIPVVIVTNQSAINRGLTTLDAVHSLHEGMSQAIRDAGGRLDAVYVCPHRPDEGCACRKPGVVLFRRAAADMEVDLAGSYLIGDSLSDLEAGWHLNLRVILVRTGLGEQTAARLNRDGRQVRIVRDVLEAARWIAIRYNKEYGRDSHVVGAVAMHTQHGRR